MPSKKEPQKQQVLLDNDFTAKDVTENSVGRKALSLFELRDIDVPVPPFVVISSDVFSQFITRAVDQNTDKDFSVVELADRIKKHNFSNGLIQQISKGYARLSGFADSWVAIRSSIVLPTNKRNISFAGILGTELNIKGIDNVLDAVRNVYASAFTPTTANYLSRNNMSISDIKVAIVIQKMIQAEASGVVYTIDPISQNTNLLTIESVFGLGSVIANGDITPDQYIIEKETLTFKEKRIIPQEWMMIRKIHHKDNQDGNQKIKISKAWQHHQKLGNPFIEELAKIALVIEKQLGEPQDIEWVFESGRLWILQTREVQPINIPNVDINAPLKIDQSIINAAKEIALTENSRIKIREIIKDTDILITKPLTRQVIHQPQYKNATKDYKPQKGEKLILTGIGASQGTFRGNVVIMSNSKDIKKIGKKDNEQKLVLVLRSENEHIDKHIPRIGAIVSDTGGITSDIAITCREMKIPCVVGCHIASRMLLKNESILVDGNVGAVYGMRTQLAQTITPAVTQKKVKAISTTTTSTKKTKPGKTKPVPKKIQTATKVLLNMSRKVTNISKYSSYLQESDGIASIVDTDIYTKIIKRHPSAFISDGKSEELIKQLSEPISQACELTNGNVAIVSIGNTPVSQYKKLVKGTYYERWNTKSEVNDSTIGLARMLKRPKELKVLIKAVKYVRNVKGWRKTSIAVNYPGTPAQLIDFKKTVSSAGLRRSSTFNIYMTINTPAEVMVLEDFVETGIDGVIVNINNLCKHMMAPRKDHASVVETIKKICENCIDIKVIVQIPDKTQRLLKSCIKMGIHGISVEPSDLEESQKLTAAIERELIFS